MNRLGSADFVLGLVLVAFGLWVAGYAYANYNLGTVRNMGPGMFPMWLGLILAGLGLLIFTKGLRTSGYAEPLDLRTSISVLAGVAGFALTLDRFGLVPAIFVLTILSSFASNRLTLTYALLLASVLAAMAYGVFGLLLGLQVQAFRWRP